MKPTPFAAHRGTMAADIGRKSATPGQPYGNARPGEHANDTLGPKGYQPPGGPTRVLIDQQQTPEERARLNPGPQYGAQAQAREEQRKAEAKSREGGKGGGRPSTDKQG